MHHTVPSRRRRTILAACLGTAFLPALAGAADAPASASAPAKPGGTLVIIGGALRAGNADVWSRIVALAGGPRAAIAVFPSAAGNPERSGQNIAATLRRYGAEPFVVPIAVKLAGSDYRAAADDAALAKRIREAGGVFFAGGEQARITQALVRADGSRTAALEAVWDVYRRGGVVAGTSAGAAIMSKTMFRDVPLVLAALSADMRDGHELAPGLGFIGDNVFIDQHFLVRGRFARMLPAMLKQGYRFGVGVDEDSAVVVSGNQELEVIGYKGVLLVDLSQAVASPDRGGLQVRHALLSYLDRGDRYSIATGRHVPGPDKSTAPIEPNDALALYSNDILANNAIVELMERLACSPRQEAVGIASGDPREGGPATTGFVFRLQKTPATRAYASDVADAMSVTGMRLDVEPVDMAQPRFRARKP